MWGSKKPDEPQAAKPEPKNLQANQPSGPPPTTLEGTTRMSKAARLGPSLHVKGEITGSEDLVIEGTLEGTVQLDERKLTIGAAARVTADIVAGEVVVCGNVKGNLCAKNRIEIKKEGSVTGDLTTPQILIEDGAYFKGSIEIDRVRDKEADKNVSSQTTSTAPKATAAGAGPKSM
jgi:cytoskeletal protein CcmA (bactofilin family)